MSGSKTALSFIWNGVPSENYNLYVANMDTGVISVSSGSDVEIFEQNIYRNPKPYFYGVSQTPKLEFDFSIFSPNAISAVERNLIEKWLLGNINYGILQFCQCDMDDIYYRVILTKGENFYAGNINRGLTLHAVADSPWAWKYPITTTFSYTGETVVDTTVNFINMSANNDYTYPIFEFDLNIVGTSFTITNITDDNHIFQFTDMDANEHIVVDCSKKTVVSSTGLYRLSHMTLDSTHGFFRLLPGKNVLHVLAGIGLFSITTQDAVKIGG
jgi:phage-related protein